MAWRYFHLPRISITLRRPPTDTAHAQQSYTFTHLFLLIFLFISISYPSIFSYFVILLLRTGVDTSYRVEGSVYFTLKID